MMTYRKQLILMHNVEIASFGCIDESFEIIQNRIKPLHSMNEPAESDDSFAY